MPAPAPRSRGPSGGRCVNCSPMDTGDFSDYGAVSRLMESNGGDDEGRCNHVDIGILSGSILCFSISVKLIYLEL